MAKNHVDEHPGESPLNQSRILHRPAVLFALTAIAIFVAEAGLMLVFGIFNLHLTVWHQVLLDPLLLILVLFPLLYLFTFRPLRLRNNELLRFGRQLEEQVAERRETEATLRQSEKQLHRLSAQLLTLQEKERRWISHELHEDLGQCLIVLKLRLRLLENVITKDQPVARDELRAVSDQIDNMVRNIRRLSGDLSPSILEDLGFTAAARRLIADYAAEASLQTTVTIDENVDLLLQREEWTLTYRILQEALDNVQKHADATQISVSVRQSEQGVSLTVEDDGKGFDCSAEEHRGLGLGTMHERARMLNGSLEVFSAPGEGTRITLTIPKRQEKCTSIANV